MKLRRRGHLVFWMLEWKSKKKVCLKMQHSMRFFRYQLKCSQILEPCMNYIFSPKIYDILTKEKGLVILCPNPPISICQRWKSYFLNENNKMKMITYGCIVPIGRVLTKVTFNSSNEKEKIIIYFVEHANILKKKLIKKTRKIFLM